MKLLSLFPGVLACAALALPLFAGEDKPREELVYEGRPAAEWIVDLKAGNDSTKAMRALKNIGKDALPALTRLLREDGPATERARIILDQIAYEKADVAWLVEMLKAPDAKTRERAESILTRMALDGDAPSLLAPLLKDTRFEVRRSAVWLLGLIDHPDAHAAVVSTLGDKDRAVAEVAREMSEVHRARKKMSDAERTVIEAKIVSRINECKGADSVAGAFDSLREAEKLHSIIRDPRSRTLIDETRQRLQGTEAWSEHKHWAANAGLARLIQEAEKLLADGKLQQAQNKITEAELFEDDADKSMRARMREVEDRTRIAIAEAERKKALERAAAEKKKDIERQEAEEKQARDRREQFAVNFLKEADRLIEARKFSDAEQILSGAEKNLGNDARVIERLKKVRAEIGKRP